ncbi:hypothetical protein [Sphingomonas sp. UYP23]
MTKAQPIETAPIGDGWILGYDPDLGERQYVPWLAMTWSDSGWVDDNGETRAPTLWAPLPDPQPKATGWRPVEGTILILETTGDGWSSNGKPCAPLWIWSVSIERSDGSYDDYREVDRRMTLSEAEVLALRWQAKYGLAIRTVPLGGEIVIFRPKATRQ